MQEEQGEGARAIILVENPMPTIWSARFSETAGRRIDQFLAEALDEKLEYVERVDRLANIAESRRNDSLHEIERRRIVFGQTLRQRVQQIEASELKVIATPGQGKKAA